MKILFKYLQPYRWQILLALILASFNQVFSMLDPVLFGKLIDNIATQHQKYFDAHTENEYLKKAIYIIALMIGVAMTSRIAKAFQDYVVSVIIQKFGAQIFTDGLKQAMGLQFQDFEDKRSGETLSILQKVRIDTEKFITYFINVVFMSFISICFVIWYAVNKHWALVPIYFTAIVLLALLVSYLSKKNQNDTKGNRQRNHFIGWFHDRILAKHRTDQEFRPYTTRGQKTQHQYL